MIRLIPTRSPWGAAPPLLGGLRSPKPTSTRGRGASLSHTVICAQPGPVPTHRIPTLQGWDRNPPALGSRAGLHASTLEDPQRCAHWPNQASPYSASPPRPPSPAVCTIPASAHRSAFARPAKPRRDRQTQVQQDPAGASLTSATKEPGVIRATSWDTRSDRAPGLHYPESPAALAPDPGSSAPRNAAATPIG